MDHFSLDIYKKFINLLEENKGKDMDQLLDLLKIYANSKDEIDVIDIVKLDNDIEIKTRKIVASYDYLCIGGKYGN